ncbi:hypothetical protein ACFX14_033904 [Malus domestica]
MNTETFQERSNAKLPPPKSKMKQSEAFQGRSRMNSPSLARSLGSTKHGETDATVNATTDCIRAFQLPPFKLIHCGRDDNDEIEENFLRHPTPPLLTAVG